MKPATSAGMNKPRQKRSGTGGDAAMKPATSAGMNAAQTLGVTEHAIRPQ